MRNRTASRGVSDESDARQIRAGWGVALETPRANNVVVCMQEMASFFLLLHWLDSYCPVLSCPVYVYVPRSTPFKWPLCPLLQAPTFIKKDSPGTSMSCHHRLAHSLSLVASTSVHRIRGKNLYMVPPTYRNGFGGTSLLGLWECFTPHSLLPTTGREPGTKQDKTGPGQDQDQDRTRQRTKRTKQTRKIHGPWPGLPLSPACLPYLTLPLTIRSFHVSHNTTLYLFLFFSILFFLPFFYLLSCMCPEQ